LAPQLIALTALGSSHGKEETQQNRFFVARASPSAETRSHAAADAKAGPHEVRVSPFDFVAQLPLSRETPAHLKAVRTHFLGRHRARPNVAGFVRDWRLLGPTESIC
jgi:hypothetical protein